MAYPMPVIEQPLIAPTDGATNITGRATPSIDQLYDWFPPWSTHAAGFLRILDANAHPWWTSRDRTLDIGDGAFSSAFSDAFRKG